MYMGGEDAETEWVGLMTEGGETIRWMPHELRGLSLVPGFTQLYVKGTTKDAWRIHRAIFLDEEIIWKTP